MLSLNRATALLMAALIVHACGTTAASAQTAPPHQKGSKGAHPAGSGKPAGAPKAGATTGSKTAGKKGPAASGPAAVAPQARSAPQGGPPPQGHPPEQHGHKSKSNFGIGVGVAAGILATILAAQAAKPAQDGPPPSDDEDELARQCRRWDRLCEEEGARWACRRLERECN